MVFSLKSDRSDLRVFFSPCIRFYFNESSLIVIVTWSKEASRQRRQWCCPFKSRQDKSDLPSHNLINELDGTIRGNLEPSQFLVSGSFEVVKSVFLSRSRRLSSILGVIVLSLEKRSNEMNRLIAVNRRHHRCGKNLKWNIRINDDPNDAHLGFANPLIHFLWVILWPSLLA